MPRNTPQSVQSMTTLPFYTAVTEDFEAVNQLIMRQLHSRVPLVEKIGSYIISAGGKRLRPLVVLLSARACGMNDPRQHSLATIIEFLHTATLLHDDVVDTSDLRRGRSTANALWGNAPSVLVGDFLFTRAFELMVEMGDMEIMRVLANATNVVAEGEVLQLTKVRDANTDEATYMKVIRSKTAMLFEASSHTGAMLAGASAAQTEALRRYGDALGIAFQLIDDLLDYSGDAEAMGKNVGDDLAEGKPTLPLIYTMREGTEAQAQLVRKAIQKGGADEIEAIQAAVRASGALEYTEKLARKMSEEAVELLQVLPGSEFKDALEQLARFAVDRKY